MPLLMQSQISPIQIWSLLGSLVDSLSRCTLSAEDSHNRLVSISYENIFVLIGNIWFRPFAAKALIGCNRQIIRLL
jgi:hypothetical protein